MDVTVTIGAVAVVIRIVVSALRRAGLPDRITPLVALAMGAAIFAADAFVRGGDYLTALLSGLLAGGSAVGLYELQHQTFKPLPDEDHLPEG